jgi:hypothetical protein
MRKSSFVVIAAASVGISCGERPTQPLTRVDATVSLAAGTGDGTSLLRLVDQRAELTLPTGVCGFRLDAPTELTSFVRTEFNGSRHLVMHDESGSVTVDAVGGPSWVGKGRISVDWPDYPSGDTFEITVSGSESSAAATVSCKYQIANGVGVDWFVNTR